MTHKSHLATNSRQHSQTQANRRQEARVRGTKTLSVKSEKIYEIGDILYYLEMCINLAELLCNVWMYLTCPAGTSPFLPEICNPLSLFISSLKVLRFLLYHIIKRIVPKKSARTREGLMRPKSSEAASLNRDNSNVMGNGNSKISSVKYIGPIPRIFKMKDCTHTQSHSDIGVHYYAYALSRYPVQHELHVKESIVWML